MNIATALNQKYIAYTYVMLTSFLENNREEHNTIYLLHHELTKEDIQYFHDDFANYDVTIVPLQIDRSYFTEEFPVSEKWSVEMYYRLLLLDVLPAEIDRMLYLDVDMIVNQSVHDFYYSDFHNKLLKVCVNSGGYIPQERRLGAKQMEMFAPMFEQGFLYFNSGMLLMNIREMKKKYSFSIYLEAMRKWEYKMGAPDQDILNYLHWNEIEYVEAEKYNYFSRIAHEQGIDYERGKEELCIIHFTDEKPWESKNYRYPIEQIWWDYAKLTPYYLGLLEDFLQKSFFDPTIEQWIRDLTNQVEHAREQLNKSMEVNQKLAKCLNLS